MIQNPKILLLDEATSALDYHSEKLIQEALDYASKGRTTIVISHRLSAIKGVDKIVFIDEGKVIEEGNHEDLMLLEGAYYQMVKAGEINPNSSEQCFKGPHNLEVNSLQETEKGDNLDSYNFTMIIVEILIYILLD